MNRARLYYNGPKNPAYVEPDRAELEAAYQGRGGRLRL